MRRLLICGRRLLRSGWGWRRDLSVVRSPNMSALQGLPSAKEPDAMGAWSESGDTVWLPRSLYPKRSGAIAWAVKEWGVTWPEVRCTTVWMRYEPFVARGYTRDDGTVDPGWSEDHWYECEDGNVPGAFRAWRLESA